MDVNDIKKIIFSFSILLFFLQPLRADNSMSDFFVEWPSHNGLPTMIKIKKQLDSCVSKFQKIEMYETTDFGTMMVIDDIIMLTQRDNFAYHEMIAHVPMIVHPSPKKVLIVGGGDGGTLTEILKHSCVEEVVLCEIDQVVIDLSKKYLPEFCAAFDDSRVTIVVEDAAVYIKSKKNYFDVICVDSTDPFGPGEVIFQEAFYRDIAQALTHDGIAVTQSESMFLYEDLIARLYKQNNKLFQYAAYYYTIVPSYPSGTIGFSFCSKKYTAFENIDADRIAKLGHLRYYNEALHTASFQLPQFLKDCLTT